AALAAEGIELLAGEVAIEGVAAAGGGLAVPVGRGVARAVRAADLVVVHAPGRPAEGAAALGRLLRVAIGDGGFLLDRAASPFEPTATRIAGVYVAGAAAGPRAIPQAIRDGKAAAGLVLASLVAGERKAIEPLAAEVEEALCGGCGVCASACPFGAIHLEGGREETAPPRPPSAPGQLHADTPRLPRPRKARVEAVHCRGCGICAAGCPTGAASARHFTRAQISAEISALLRPLEAAAPPDPSFEPRPPRDAALASGRNG
ncbi:MAG TPA: 4Fe-4S dicluster domain-containing protein, partial [Anaeromyxobacter sp.]